MNAKQFLVLITLATVVLAPQALALSKFPDIIVTMINQEPDPVSPGNSFDVRFRIENAGADAAMNVKVKLVLKYPLSGYGGELLERSLGTIVHSSSAEDLGVAERWTLYADPNAATGISKVEFWYQINNGVWSKAGDFDVTVRSPNAFLAINKITTDPDRIVPGTTTKVAFELENLADNELRDITLNLNIYTSTVTTGGVSISELPFTPIGSGNQKTLTRIARASTADISFDLFTDADAVSKVYKVPYTLTYSDASGENFTRTGVLGLLVDSDPELSIFIEKSEVMTAGSTGKVTVKLVNKGFSDIKFLDVTLKPSKEFETLSTPEIYVGKLDSDDYETAEYTIHVPSSAKDKVTLPILIDYRDSNGHLYTKELPLTLRLYTAKELKDKNGNGGNSFWFFAIVIVIAIAAVYVYRKMRHGTKKRA